MINSRTAFEQFRELFVVVQREDAELKRLVAAVKKAKEEAKRKSNPRSGWNCDTRVMKSVYSGLTKRSYCWTMRK